MDIKGLKNLDTETETPNNFSVMDKPLNSKIPTSRVDINKLKSKLQNAQDKEFKKNLYILTILVLMLGVLGIYLTL